MPPLTILQASGKAGPSLARDILVAEYERGLTPEMEERIKWTTGALGKFPATNISPANHGQRVHVCWYAPACCIDEPD